LFAPGANRDSLRFESLRVRPLGANHALATARYVLRRGDSVTSSGPFTLILVRTAAGWKIIHDHTNADPE
jgi:ketosteroid isomerase-like protein